MICGPGAAGAADIREGHLGVKARAVILKCEADHATILAQSYPNLGGMCVSFNIMQPLFQEPVKADLDLLGYLTWNLAPEIDD